MQTALYSKVMPADLVDRVLAHPSMHLCVMVTSLRSAYHRLSEWTLKALFYVGVKAEC